MSSSWREALDCSLSANSNDPTSRYFQLATNGSDGYPANRTVVFRGFRTKSDDLLMATDARSRKVAEALRNPKAEASWWFGATREQFRFRGLLRVIDGSDRALVATRVEIWRSLSDAVRRQFTWPMPGATWTDRPELFRRVTPERGTPTPPFVVLSMKVDRIDYLSLAVDPPTRLIYEATAETWSSERVNP